MPWLGHQLQNRDACALVAPHWPNQKAKALATMNAESRRFVGAIREYENGDADIGLFEHNVKADSVERLKPTLWTDSKDPAVYMPIARENVRLAYEKWNSRWNRPAGQPQKRLWQPWVAYTTGWAMFPEYWVWRHQKDEDGNLTIPVGPWIPTGRYLHDAIRGVVNWHLLVNNTWGEMSPEDRPAAALDEARRLASQYKVTKGAWEHSANKAVYYVPPQKPTSPPADGIGPRPKPNDGT